MPIPSRMRAVILKSFESQGLAVEQILVPAIKPGHVLVKMAAASINPSDLVFLKNRYGIKKPLPVVPGFEGSGTVVASGGGFYAGWLVNKRVACHAPEDGNGTWAEYLVAPTSTCTPLLKEVSLEQGASFMVNPLTAWTLLTIAREEGHQAFVQTAAAGSVGRMMERLARRWGLASINIVRRREQTELLKKEGAMHALDTSQTGWKDQLKVLCDHHAVHIAFDAVGGALTSEIAQAMPKGARVIVYGALAGENCQISPRSLIYENKRLEGFWLTEWVKKQTLWQKLRMVHGAQKLLSSDLKTDVQARFPLEKIQEAIELYKTKRTEGKVLLSL